MTLISTNSVNMTDSGSYKSQIPPSTGPWIKDVGHAQLGADTPSIMQNAEIQFDPIDVYCFICFTPFSNEEVYGRIADNYRLSESGYNCMGDRYHWAQEQQLFFYETQYVHDNCGKHNGKLIICDPLTINCPTDPINNSDVIRERIEQAKKHIINIVTNSWYFSAPGFTLHLAIYGYTDTLDIAYCFLNSCSYEWNKRPKDSRFSQFVTIERKVADAAYSMDVVIRIEYVQQLSTHMPSHPTDKRIVDLLNELARESVETWETTINNLKIDYIENYRIKSKNIHSFCENGQEILNGISLLMITGAQFVGLASIAAPELLVVAAILAQISQQASTASAVLKCVDGFTYVRDYEVLNDEKALKKGQIILITAAVEGIEQELLGRAKVRMKLSINDLAYKELIDNTIDHSSWWLFSFEDIIIEKMCLLMQLSIQRQIWMKMA